MQTDSIFALINVFSVYIQVANYTRKRLKDNVCIIMDESFTEDPSIALRQVKVQ